MCMQFDIDDDNDIKAISAKTGAGVKELLSEIVEKFPAPTDVDLKGNFKGFLIDSWFVKDLGVILLFNTMAGEIRKGDQIMSCHFKKNFDVFEVKIIINIII